MVYLKYYKPDWFLLAKTQIQVHDLSCGENAWILPKINNQSNPTIEQTSCFAQGKTTDSFYRLTNESYIFQWSGEDEKVLKSWIFYILICQGVLQNP